MSIWFGCYVFTSNKMLSVCELSIICCDSFFLPLYFLFLFHSLSHSLFLSLSFSCSIILLEIFLFVFIRFHTLGHGKCHCTKQPMVIFAVWKFQVTCLLYSVHFIAHTVIDKTGGRCTFNRHVDIFITFECIYWSLVMHLAVLAAIFLYL